MLNTSNTSKAMMGQQATPPHFSWNWNSSCQAKHKFFFWLLLLDKLNTRNLLGRKIFQVPSFNCATLNCPQEETLIHLFWNCPFAAKCWDFICPQRTRNLSVLEAFSDMKIKSKSLLQWILSFLQLGESGWSEITRYSRIKGLLLLAGKQFICKS